MAPTNVYDGIEPVVLIIRDGWGENPNADERHHNAIQRADTPVDDALRHAWPSTLIRTSGEDVGLPTGTMGNSEVGHQNIGAGRIVDQELMRITRTIRDGSFADRPAFAATFEYLDRTGGRLHLLGLVSRGLVHSDLDHLVALLDVAASNGRVGDQVVVHAITDGRDTGPTTGRAFLAEALTAMQERGVGVLGSVIGRYWAMDRDHRWDRTALAYRCLTGRSVSNDGMPESATDAIDVLSSWYGRDDDNGRAGDEFVPPTMLRDETGAQRARITDGDAVIFFNFRGDRPRQLTKAFVLDDAAWSSVEQGGFDRGEMLDSLRFVTMTGYEEGLPVSDVLFPRREKMPMILGETVSRAERTQFRCAETEKFAHVTYFFNDYREAPFTGESRTLIPSPRDVATYDLRPEMSAAEVCEAVLDRLAADDCEAMIIVNFANPDMVGHTGNVEAVVRAVEVVDACVGRIVEATRKRGGAVIITADHGNAERMWNDETNSPHTAHTTFDVPLIIVGDAVHDASLRSDGRLADIAPTMLHLLGLEQPSAMTGVSLLC